MPTEGDFLVAIDANLDDDAPRLAHADWLEKRDPERAEYVRLEVRMARAPWRSWRGEDERRAGDLLHANQQRWLAGRPQARGVQWRFERGYPENVTFSTRAAFDAHWRQALTPPLRWVSFSGLRNPHWFVDSPTLARVRWLHVRHCHVNDFILRRLLDSPHLGTLQGLAFALSDLNGAALRLIASSPKLAGLLELDLGGCCSGSFTPDDLTALTTSPNLSGLRKLDLWGWRLDNELVRLLWAARWPDLVSLRLRQNDLDAEGFLGLGDGARLPALARLDLSNNRLGDDGAAALARVSAWSRLRWLDVSGNLIGERGVRALAGAAHLAGLEYLNLGGNAVPDGGAEALASMESLVVLWLPYNVIGDAGVMALGRSPALSRLRWCSLSDNPARPAVIAAVEERFEKGGPPLADVEATPATVAAPAAGGAAVGHVDEDALVRALYAAPYDELARGAYADWLEENGSSQHARLLRPRSNDPPRSTTVEAISRSSGVSPRFEVHLGEEDGLLFGCLGVRFLLSKDFRRDGPAWLRQNHVSNLFIAGDSKDWSRVGNSPVASHLRGLWFRNQRLRDRGLVQLASASGLANLGSLDLHNAQVGDEGVRALASSTNFPRLSHLSLFWARTSVETVRALASGPLAAALRCLDLGQARLNDVGVAVLAHSPGLSGLVTLKVEGNGLGDRSVLSLIDSPHLGNLRGLDLSNNHYVRDAGILALARSPLASRLQWLRMRNVSVSQETRETLARALPSGGRLVLD